jgi:hypothetical protein
MQPRGGDASERGLLASLDLVDFAQTALLSRKFQCQTVPGTCSRDFQEDQRGGDQSS